MTTQKKIKPIQIVFFVFMCALSIAFFIFKDKFIPDANALIKKGMLHSKKPKLLLHPYRQTEEQAKKPAFFGI